jgi:hypothetical protein
MKLKLNEVKAMNKIAGTKLTKEQEIKVIKERISELQKTKKSDINESAEMEAVKDLITFISDNAGFLAGIGGIVGLSKFIANKLAKDPKARKALDKATGAGSADLGPFGGKSFGKNK